MKSDDGCCVFCLFSVFWDLYCAAPERRDTCEHSSEAKAFHDYVRTASYHFVRREHVPDHSLKLLQNFQKVSRILEANVT